MHKQIITAASLFVSTAAYADEIKIGVFMGFTGPIESLVTNMAPAAELAINEADASGNFLGGTKIVSVRADTTCTDAAAATAAAERLVTSDQVAGIVGGDCSGVTTAALANVGVPNGIVMISPSATSPALSTIEDGGFFFRTAPSDARQGVVMAEIVLDRGLKEIAVTYTNNDYGKGLADAFREAFEARGGSVTTVVSHEDGKADYSAEVASLAAIGGEALAVVGYLDQGGAAVIQAALDSGAFDTFVLPDGMVGDALVQTIGSGLNGSFGQAPGTDSPGAAKLQDLADGFDATSPYAAESYDAAALILLAMQAAGSSDPTQYKDTVFDVANAPGEQIYPGELGKALEIIAAGGDIDYVGASNVELVGAGESAGSYREIQVADEALQTVGFR
ncbi:ABC transporter substrate-binding protein [Litoreibacter sp.]|nr:ABC transporter substrate-binding protein [Litoreibacter sp.]